MLRTIMLTATLLLAGCASPQYDAMWAFNKTMSHRFTYVSDDDKWGQVEKWETTVTGDGRFSGDCEEYAFAVKRQLAKKGVKSDVWHVAWEGQGHAVTCTEDGWCFDYDRAPIRREDAPYEFIKVVKI